MRFTITAHLVIMLVCTTCGESYAYKPSLNRHQHVDHEIALWPNDKFVCGTCNKEYAFDSSLRRHQHRIHETTRSRKKTKQMFAAYISFKTRFCII
ncbi:hypothetical protein BKA58DRAFT_144919 [Alternaria rosae]|uniref:uncharacterized protein n=1 Tax=Alternaria rosae TaxID=1187941 RepID=UPI001E8EDAEF|nr:uncharacterized protein BKA58DRAFT_144919 [Alternaria rosae]KAH6872405.1 hypothetical protein BKA58DRAFT_144919 [Alternaria rosae]